MSMRWLLNKLVKVESESRKGLNLPFVQPHELRHEGFEVEDDFLHVCQYLCSLPSVITTRTLPFLILCS
jgi:hypothetical protein